MKYNEYSFSTIKKLISQGQEAAKKGVTKEEFTYTTDYSLAEYEKIMIGFDYPDYDFNNVEIKEYYRIGEPILNAGGSYKPSYNFAEQRPEDGVSVVTLGWLHSFKSIFFNTTNENIKKRGVWKIKGFALPSKGGDDELLIIPLDFAEKTKIRTRDGLEKAVKKAGY